jgi:putative DNA primase/helicase
MMGLLIMSGYTDDRGQGNDTHREAAAEAQAALTPLEAARAYVAAGLSVVPISPDGRKQPTVKWKTWQGRLPWEKVITGWWKQGDHGIAVIAGAISGGAECIDFDRGELFAAWCELVEAQCPGLVDRLCHVQTPRTPPGHHVWYRCQEVAIPGNTKLAQEPGTDTKTGKPKAVTLIETRGEGGYAIVPGGHPNCHPSKRPYEHVAGPPLTELPVIFAAEREILMAAARSFDKSTAAKKGSKPRAASGPNGASTGLRPGDDYDRRGPDWTEILEPHGWERMLERGTVTYWRRPGKDDPGWSATTGYCTGQDGVELLAVFSSNAHPFEGPAGSRSCTCYDKFAAYTLLNHDSDFKAAARELSKQGYGEQRHRANGQAHSPGASQDDTGAPSTADTSVGAADRASVKLTDRGNGIRMARMHGQDLRHCWPWHRWLCWDERRWRADDTGEPVRRAKQTVTAMAKQAVELLEAVATKLAEMEGEGE